MTSDSILYIWRRRWHHSIPTRNNSAPGPVHLTESLPKEDDPHSQSPTGQIQKQLFYHQERKQQGQ